MLPTNTKLKKHANPGDVYTFITVVREGPKNVRGERQVWCLCSCRNNFVQGMPSKVDANRGKEFLVRVKALVYGDTQSCGCKRIAKLEQSRATRKSRQQATSEAAGGAMKETDEERTFDNWLEYATDAGLAQKLDDPMLDPDERRRIEEQLAHRASWKNMTDEQRKAVLDKARADVAALEGLGTRAGVLNGAQARAFTRKLVE